MNRSLLKILLNTEFYLKKTRKIFHFPVISKVMFADSNTYKKHPMDFGGSEEEKKSVISFTNSDSRLDKHAFFTRGSYLLPNAMLNTNSGLVYLDGNKLISETSSWPRSELIRDYYNGSTILRYVKEKHQEREFYTVLPSSGFYHWLLEDLPRYLFLHAQDSRKFRTIIFRNAPSYVLDLLAMLKIDFIASPRIVAINNLVIAEKNPETGYPNPYDVEILRKRLLPRNLLCKNEKIYISRLKSSRSPSWECQLIQILSKNGWLIVEPEKLTLENQISIFASAKYVCGIHGAGLSGTVWTKPESKVIELRDSFRSDCFVRLSQVLGNHHHVLDTSQGNHLSLSKKIESLIM